MAECWEEHNRYAIHAHEIAASYRIAADQGYLLMGQREVGMPVPVMIFIITEEHAAPEFCGHRYAVRLQVVRDDAEGLEWFEEMLRVRPWETRQ